MGVVVVPALRASAAMDWKPCSRAAMSAGPDGRVSLAYTILAGFEISIRNVRTNVSSTSMSASAVGALAIVVAWPSQATSSISPRGSTSFTPLS